MSLARAGLAVALASLLAGAGCAGARPLPASAWQGREALAPAPDRVPLALESAGELQQVALARDPAAVRETPARAPALCETPCTLYVRPGRAGLFARGRDVRASYSVLDVRAPGRRVRLRAPSERAFVAARTTAVGGAFLLTLGAIFAVAGPLEVRNGEDAGVSTTVLGGALLAVGAAFLVPSVVVLNHLAPGPTPVAALTEHRARP